MNKSDVWQLYQDNAARFDEDRGRFGAEEKYLQKIAEKLPEGGTILDVGCGSGVPIARYFIERGLKLTGVDAAAAMIELCRERYPEMTWLVEDMRKLALKERFDAIVAWDSFFHLPHEDQRGMFPLFAEHIKPGGYLLFTSGPEHGEAIGELYGKQLYHASLSAEEYTSLLQENGFSVVLNAVEDPECGNHTIWLANAL